MFEHAVREGVLRLARPDTRWLSSGWAGGLLDAGAAYNVSVPEGFDRTDLDAYIDERRERAGFETTGPTLLTGVDLRHARGARAGPVEAVVTAGVSNPAALPMEPGGASDESDGSGSAGSDTEPGDEPWRHGTVNVIVGTIRALDDAGLATLLTVAAEAKTATLLAETGFPGTTTDATIAACDPAGEAATFAGSATETGAAARACVRDALRASLASRYAERDPPGSVAAAQYGVTTDRRAETFGIGSTTRF